VERTNACKEEIQKAVIREKGKGRGKNTDQHRCEAPFHRNRMQRKKEKKKWCNTNDDRNENPARTSRAAEEKR